MTYRDWCMERGVSHAHCKMECEHPQPFVLEGELFCGRCFHLDDRISAMIPCTPEVCEEA